MRETQPAASRSSRAPLGQSGADPDGLPVASTPGSRGAGGEFRGRGLPPAAPVHPLPATRARPGGGERLGLFGGSFDPVHSGHLHAAEAARRAFELDRVLLMPAARSPHKQRAPRAPGEDRVRLLEIATRDLPGLEVSRLELERGGPSYTIDTVRALLERRRPAQLYLVIGADNLRGLGDWRGVDELLDLAQPIVVHRGPDPRALLADLDERLAPRHRAALERGLVLLAPVEVSATELRARLARGEDPGPDLPTGVLEAIRTRGLYAWPT